MKAQAIQSILGFKPPYEVTEVCFDSGQFSVVIMSTFNLMKVSVNFPEVAGFRFLDEGDLLEFWPTCSASKGAIFQIMEGGWFAQESQRPGFLKKDVDSIYEFFIASQNGCVNVLAWDIPEILQLPFPLPA